MTPKEKAKELVSKFNFEHIGQTYILYQTVDESKRCALIAVDEILDELPFENKNREYWYKVQFQIEKL
jgi:hypothetical protein